MTNNNITLKNVRVCIKRGLTAKDIVEKYGLQSEEELYSQIRKMTYHCKSIIADIRKNEKKNVLKKKAEKGEENPKDYEEEELEISPESEEVAEEMESEVQTVATQTLETTEANSRKTLEDLLEEEANLSQEVCALEGAHKEKIQKRRTIMDNLLEIRKESENMLENLACLREKAEQLKSEYDETATEMRGMSEEISIYKEILAELRAQIENAKKLTILVYSDGNIEIESKGVEVPIFVIPVEEQNAILTSLITQPEAEGFTIRELKTLARLLPMVRQLEGIKYEIVFDNPKLENFYQSIAATAAESA